MDLPKKDNLPDLFNLDTYDFSLPSELIASLPPKNRGTSRLLVLDKKGGDITLASFKELARFLPPKSLLVANNTKVLPARIWGRKKQQNHLGGKVEFLLLTPFPLLKIQDTRENFKECIAEGLLRASKRPKPGQEVVFTPDFSLEVLETGDFGQAKVKLIFQGDLKEKFLQLGHIPLPPYIKRADTDLDRERYQTIYAAEEKIGAVAAPTAGLHFSPELQAKLTQLGFDFAYITLYVGYGTFSPIRTQDIRQHQMHGEYFEIPEQTARKIQEAKKNQRPVIAIGTTTVRTLEGAYQKHQKIRALKDVTDIYIFPGYEFKVVDHLITNFHLPKSSLIIMVSAFAGLENIKRAYKLAIEEKFRFFSYGDAMLII